MSFAYKLLPHYTYSNYLAWEGDWELIDGIPYAMSPSPRPLHQLISGNLHAEFRTALKASGCQCKVYQPIDYLVAEDTVLRPDVLICCRPVTGQYLDFPPELVVEILSPATAMKDRHTKMMLYQQQGIPYYIIVDADKNKVEVYQLNEQNMYENIRVNQQEAFEISFGDCRFSIVFDAIWL